MALLTGNRDCKKEKFLLVRQQSLKDSDCFWEQRRHSIKNRPYGNDSTLLPPANEVWGKVIFLHLFVILFTGGGVPDQVHPRTRYTPWDQVPPLAPGTSPSDQVHPPGPVTSPRPGTPPGPGTPPQTRYTLQTRYPPDQVHPPRPGTPPQTRYPPDQVHPTPDQVHPPDQVPPRPVTHPPGPGTHPSRSSEIRSTRGLYASYWNAILCLVSF